MKAERLLWEAERLNGYVDGAWVTITAHPVFTMARWVVRLEGGTGDRKATVASGFILKQVLREARQWCISSDRSMVDEALDRGHIWGETT